MQQNHKRTNDGEEDTGRPPKRQRHASGKELSTVPLRSTVDTCCIPHEPMSLITPSPNSPRMNMATVVIGDLEQTPAENADCTKLTPTGQLSNIAIPSKRSYPFGKDVPRKKRKKKSYVTVRVYKQRKDLEHTVEIECALMPDGGLDLVALSQELNVKGCQASRCNVIRICDSDYLIAS